MDWRASERDLLARSLSPDFRLFELSVMGREMDNGYNEVVITFAETTR